MRRRDGYTLIELTLVLMLLILVASVVFTLAGAGSRTYLRIAAKQSQASDMRTALSYIDVQIRKHDVKDALSIRPDPFDNKPALTISQEIEGKTYLTWIYLRDGYLCELFIAEDTIISSSMGSRITAVDDMKLEVLEDGSLNVTLIRQAEGQAIIRSSRIIGMRAGGVNQ